MKNFIITLLAFVALVGCSAEDQAKYDESQAFVAFKSNLYDLKVPINSSNTVDLVLQASNKVSTARTYNVEIIAAETDANPATYSFPATFTIPADSYTGVLTVTGTDNSLVDANVKKLTLKITGFGGNESFDKDIVVVNIVEFCAVDINAFTGLFNATSWWAGSGINEIIQGPSANTLAIVDFFDDDAVNPDFVITFDPNNNNKVTFVDRNTGSYSAVNGGFIWARMSAVASNVSSVDACTGRVSLWVNYYIPGVGAFGDKNEVFVKR